MLHTWSAIEVNNIFELRNARQFPHVIYDFFFVFSPSDQRPEQSIASARAQVMIYDDLNKKWMPSGTSHGLSKVHIYHHFINSTFRVVGRKLGDHEVRKRATEGRRDQ